MKPRLHYSLAASLALACSSFALAPGCAQAEAGPPSNEPLAAYRLELLDLGFDAASAMPAMPHIKSRSRAQEGVFVAALELDLPARARAYLEGIDNWRKGAAYADLAFYHAKRGETEAAERCLALALPFSESREGAEEYDEGIEGEQDWRRDRVRAKIARTYVWLGRAEQAAEFEQGLEPSELGAIAAVKARTLESAAFDGQVASLESVATSGSFDQVRNAVLVANKLYDRFYADGGRREIVEAKLPVCLDKAPTLVGVETWMELAEIAVEHGDEAHALVLAGRAQALVRGADCGWRAEDEARLLTRLSRIRHDASADRGALDELDAVLALYTARRAEISDADRPDVLRPIAEAYLAMGSRTKALDVYALAVEEGGRNVNARPRAEDLAATCSSMALHACEPGPELWTRLRQLRAGLAEPW
jgi:hypothetical protein